MSTLKKWISEIPGPTREDNDEVRSLNLGLARLVADSIISLREGELPTEERIDLFRFIRRVKHAYELGWGPGGMDIDERKLKNVVSGFQGDDFDPDDPETAA